MTTPDLFTQLVVSCSINDLSHYLTESTSRFIRNEAS